jgi:Ala-tRNA(Pro) deacylase
MIATENELFERFEKLGIDTQTVRHQPMFTVEDGIGVIDHLTGGHCKSLFLKDKKAALWLVVVLGETRLDMKTLQPKLGSARLSFAKPELMRDVLGVEPGSVTPFSVINDSAAQVQVVLDQTMMAHEILNYHPLSNAATTSIRSADLMTFLIDCGHDPVIIEV